MQTSKQSDGTGHLVIVGIDLSQQSLEVLQRAAKLAAMTEGELHLVHVVPGDAVGSLQGDAKLRLAAVSDEVRAELRQQADTVPAAVKRIVLHVRIGKPDVELAQLASDLGADLIVVGTHGHGPLERLILGSVAESLLRNAPCPVLVCRPKAVRPWEQIEPPCPDCLAVQQKSGRKALWCERHSQHRPRAHTYSEIPPSFGIGSQTLR